MKLPGKKEQPASAQKGPEEEAQKLIKTTRVEVAKYELSDNKLKFFVAKGFGKKKWILVREIPVSEIEHVESEGNQIGLTVNASVEWFYMKDERATFDGLAEQLAAQVSEPLPTQDESLKQQAAVQQQPPEPQQAPEILPQKEEKVQPDVEVPQETKQIKQEPTPAQLETQPQQQEPKKPEAQKPIQKLRSIKVGKCVISEGKLALSAEEGVFKKKWAVIREIPVAEIEEFDSQANIFTVTWKGNAEKFELKEEPEAIKAVADQIVAALEERRKNEEKRIAELNEKNNARKAELLAVISKSVDIVDSAFNLLVSLQEKRIKWAEVEAYCSSFGENLNFRGQTLPPLSLDYSKFASLAKNQAPREAANEAFGILKATYGYFADLKPEEDLRENTPNFENAKDLINAYYLINDLLLGKFVGDRNFEREIGELESTLLRLATANFKVDFEALKGNIYAEGDKREILEDSRALFKEQFKML